MVGTRWDNLTHDQQEALKDYLIAEGQAPETWEAKTLTVQVTDNQTKVSGRRFVLNADGSKLQANDGSLLVIRDTYIGEGDYRVSSAGKEDTPVP